MNRQQRRKQPPCPCGHMGHCPFSDQRTVSEMLEVTDLQGRKLWRELDDGENATLVIGDLAGTDGVGTVICLARAIDPTHVAAYARSLTGLRCRAGDHDRPPERP